MFSFSYLLTFSPDIQKILSDKMCSQHYLDENLKNVDMNYVLCYTDDFEIIGIVAISHSPKVDYSLTLELSFMETEFSDNITYINSLWVDEKQRGKGIGKMLLQYAYLLWFGSKNQYLSSSVRKTSALYLSNYYDKFPKLGVFTSSINGRDYEVYYIKKLPELLK